MPSIHIKEVYINYAVDDITKAEATKYAHHGPYNIINIWMYGVYILNNFHCTCQKQKGRIEMSILI